MMQVILRQAPHGFVAGRIIDDKVESPRQSLSLPEDEYSSPATSRSPASRAGRQV